MKHWLILLACGLSTATMAETAVLDRTPLEAVTVDGEKVRLFPNGRWEFVDTEKAATAKELSARYPENKTRPVEAQGGLFGGFGRTIMPGDKDYNRGSLNPKIR